MDLLAELESSRQQVTVLEGRIAAFSTDLSTANATVASNAVELAAVQGQLETSRGETAAVRGELATATATIGQHEATILARCARITELETAARTAEQLAMERSGKGGAPAKKKPAGAAASTPAEAMAEYNAITDPKARADYYAANKAILFPAKK